MRMQSVIMFNILSFSTELNFAQLLLGEEI